MLIHAMFTAQARRTPETVALVNGTDAFTYAEIDHLTGRLAYRLQRAGVGPEVVVGCWARESMCTVIQMLAVLKAGGAYLLLDPQLPADRLRYMVDDADPGCILSDGPAPDAIVGQRQTVLMDNPAHDHVDTGAPPAGVTADNLAYVAYTSGSTGRPKGVLVPHGAVANHALALHTQLDLEPGDRLPLMAPVAFDVATEEILPPLISGCTLVDMPVRDPTMAEFTEDVLASGYTVLNLAAPFWHQWTAHLTRTRAAVPPTLRLVIVGSEKIYTAALREWMALPGAETVRWVAAYGLTEATVTSLLYCTAGEDDLSEEPLVPIGTPIGGVSAHVVDDGGALVQPGEVGELYIGGAGLARGYQKLAGKTAEGFLHNPFDAVTGARRYRTGDLARMRADGTLVWLGRRDSQIKINGLRIEPAEIEATVHGFPGVSDAVVVYRQPERFGMRGRLVCYLQAKDNDTIDIRAVTAFLNDRLHPLTVPDDIIAVEQIPLNQNGKIDRAALRIGSFGKV